MAPTNFILLQSGGSRMLYLERKIFQGNVNLIFPKFFFYFITSLKISYQIISHISVFPAIFMSFIDFLVLTTINTLVYCCLQRASPLLLKPWYHFDSHYLSLTTILYMYNSIMNGYLESDYLFFLLNYRATFYS
jgi:hypothetical protein